MFSGIDVNLNIFAVVFISANINISIVIVIIENFVNIFFQRYPFNLDGNCWNPFVWLMFLPYQWLCGGDLVIVHVGSIVIEWLML